MITTSSLFHEYFGQLKGLPCWEASSEFGTWLSLSFGQPSIHIREGNPNAESERGKRRRVYVKGEFLLWFEMGEWEYFEGSKRKYHSGQKREYLRRTAARLQSQCLESVQLVSLPAEMIFKFDMGGHLHIRPSADAENDDSLWHLYTSTHCLTLLADGTLEYGPSSNRESEEIKAQKILYEPNNSVRDFPSTLHD